MKSYLKLAALSLMLVLFVGPTFLKSFAMGKQAREDTAKTTQVPKVKKRVKMYSKETGKPYEMTKADSVQFEKIHKKMIEDNIEYYKPEVPKLIEGLKSEDWEERAGCAYALGKSRDMQVVNPLINVFLKDKRPYARVNAIIATGYVEEYNKDTTAVLSLISALEDTITDVSFHAALALAVLGDTVHCVQILEQLARGKHQERWTVDWYGYIGKSVKGEELEKVKEQMRANMRNRAIEVLGSMGTQQTQSILREVGLCTEDSEIENLVNHVMEKGRSKISPGVLH